MGEGFLGMILFTRHLVSVEDQEDSSRMRDFSICQFGLKSTHHKPEVTLVKDPLHLKSIKKKRYHFATDPARQEGTK